tara:strand:+ start:212 stop:562 length:351 start_codon:yes stop_codon:yes gene_type:complete
MNTQKMLIGFLIGTLVLMTILIAILVIKIKKSSKESFVRRKGMLTNSNMKMDEKQTEMLAARAVSLEENAASLEENAAKPYNRNTESRQKFCDGGKVKGYCGAIKDNFRRACPRTC